MSAIDEKVIEEMADCMHKGHRREPWIPCEECTAGLRKIYEYLAPHFRKLHAEEMLGPFTHAEGVAYGTSLAEAQIATMMCTHRKRCFLQPAPKERVTAELIAGGIWGIRMDGQMQYGTSFTNAGDARLFAKAKSDELEGK